MKCRLKYGDKWGKPRNLSPEAIFRRLMAGKVVDMLNFSFFDLQNFILVVNQYQKAYIEDSTYRDTEVQNGKIRESLEGFISV